MVCAEDESEKSWLSTFIHRIDLETFYLNIYETLKVPVRSNFRKFIFLDFSKVYVAVTYPAKPFFDPSTGSPFFPTVFLVILRPPLIGHVPTAQ